MKAPRTRKAIRWLIRVAERLIGSLERLDDKIDYDVIVTTDPQARILKAAYSPEKIASLVGQPAPLFGYLRKAVTAHPNTIKVDYDAAQHLPEGAK